MPGLGRRVEFDERSRNFPVRALLADFTPLTRIWPCDVVLDQGNDGACVGFSWAQELAAEPDVILTDYEAAMALYHRAQYLDQWPETPPAEGSSVLAGAKAVMETGALIEYRWAFGQLDALQALSQLGPGVMGTNWYDSMFDLNSDGFLEVNGSVVGGHAILVRGVNMEEGYVLLHNSWGPNWGTNGTAKLSLGDFERLLQQDGEFCIPLVRSQIPIPPPEPAPEPEGCLVHAGEMVVPRRIAEWMRRWLSK